MADRALVLGAGGVTGIAWELGVVARLRELGVDLTTADLVVGTSAGSVVGAQLATGVDPQERYEAQLAPPDGSAPAAGRGGLLRIGLAAIGRRDPQRVRARIGRIALTASRVPEGERIAAIAQRLPVHEWPERALRIAVVDAHSGEFVALDRDSGVPLVKAVAASCAVPGVWPPVSSGRRRFIDGGVRSPVNADLAAGYERVVVLAPLVRGFGPMIPAAHQVAELRAAGASVELVGPDAAARTTIGRNVLDPTRRAAAARAGHLQADEVADVVAAVWNR